MNKIILKCLPALVFITATCSIPAVMRAQSVHYYLSPGGHDEQSGLSLQQSFATLEKARDAVRSIRKEHPSDTIYVNLAAGEYTIAAPLVLKPEDGGTLSAPVIYRAMPGEKATWNGAKKISGWKKYKKNIWVADIPEVRSGSWSFKRLFVGGEARTRARMPKSGYYRVKGFPDGGYGQGPIEQFRSRFEYKAGDLLTSWKNKEDIDVVVYHFWTDQHLEIKSIDDKEHIVTFKNPSGKIFTDDFNYDGARYIVDNVWEGLQAPGDWYLDKKLGKLYYIPMEGEDMRNLIAMAPFTPAFIHIEGDTLQKKWVSNIQFRDLEFLYSNEQLPAGNTNNDQASCHLPASIILTGATDCVFDHCTISRISGYAFDVQQGSSGNIFSYNQLNHLAGGGFRVNGAKAGAHPLLQTHSNIISDNEIGQYGEQYPSAVGVLLMQTHNNQVVHNYIHDGYYTGISIGWEWGYQRSISRDNIIAFNHIHDIGKGLLSDMGGIYTLGLSPGTVIRNNLVHDVESHNYGGWGIYNDEGSTHILVENNIVYNTKFAGYNIHYAKELTVRNNIFAFGHLQQVSRSRVEPHQSVYFENNIVYWKEGKFLDADWRDKTYKFYYGPGKDDTLRETTSTFEMDYNTYYNPMLQPDSLDLNGLTWKEWQAAGKDLHSSFTDPMFTDADHYNFTLLPGSPAFKTGFRNISMTDVGPRKGK